MKFWLSAIILMSAFKLDAAGLYDIPWDNKVWRSSVPATATSNMLIGTGTIAVYGVMVASASAANASVSIINSTSASNGIAASTFTYATGWTGTPQTPSYFIPIHKVFNEGFMATSVGASIVEFLWDWVYKPPRPADDSIGRY